MTIRSRIVAVLALGLAGCGSKPAATAAAKDTLTTRERQERESALPIPGAKGIKRALEVQDSGVSRARQVDSVANER